MRRTSLSAHHGGVDGIARTQLADLGEVVGTRLGPGPWVDVTQAAVDAHAATTGDGGWIHRAGDAAASGPFAGPIAQWGLVVGLVPAVVAGVLQVEDAAVAVPHALDDVRFPAPTPVGTAVRGRVTPTAVAAVPGGVEVVLDVVLERDGGTAPVCTLTVTIRYYP